MLTGQSPYLGDPSQILSSLLRRDPIPAQHLRPSLARDLAAVVEKGMSREARRRYASTGELSEDLSAFLDHRPVQARSVSSAERVARRLARSAPLRAVAAVTLLALAVLGTFEWRAFDRSRRQAEVNGIRAQLPPSLTLWGARNVFVTDEGRRERWSALLDQAAARCVEPLPVRLLRAGFRLDHGDPAGALEDMRAISAWSTSPFLTALTQRYAALDADAMGAGCLSLDGLPEPTQPADQFVAALHFLRAGQVHDDIAYKVYARDLLSSEDLAEHAAAQELLIQFEAAWWANKERNEERSERISAARALYDRALRLEVTTGYRTAATANLIGVILTLQERYGEAREVLGEALELAPEAYPTHGNYGIAARRMGDLRVAREHLEQAIELCPTSTPAYVTLIQVQREDEDFDDAFATLAALPEWYSDRKRLVLQGEIEFSIAIAAIAAGNEERKQAAAARAIDCFEAAEGGAQPTRSEYHVCRGLLGSSEDATHAILGMLAKDPDNWHLYNPLETLLDDTLDAETTDRVRQFLSSLRRHRAPLSLPTASSHTPSHE